jgi:Flp pilus assembly protein TadD
MDTRKLWFGLLTLIASIVLGSFLVTLVSDIDYSAAFLFEYVLVAFGTVIVGYMGVLASQPRPRVLLYVALYIAIVLFGGWITDRSGPAYLIWMGVATIGLPLALLEHRLNTVSHPRAFFRLIQASGTINRQDYETALTQLKLLIAAHPKSAPAHVERGIVHANLGDLDSARADFERAIELRPRFTDAHVNLGVIHTRREAMEDALRCYDAAIRVNPQHGMAYANRGIARAIHGDLRGGLRDVERAVQLQPDRPGTHYVRGCVYTLVHRFVDATNDFEKALSLQPGYHHAEAGLAVAYYLQGGELNASEARRIWQDLTAKEPRYNDGDWLRTELGWSQPLVEAARKVIALT